LLLLLLLLLARRIGPLLCLLRLVIRTDRRGSIRVCSLAVYLQTRLKIVENEIDST